MCLYIYIWIYIFIYLCFSNGQCKFVEGSINIKVYLPYKAAQLEHLGATIKVHTHT